MAGELATTNLLLGIMAAVSILEALALFGLGIAGFMAYKNVMEIVNGIETPASGILISKTDRSCKNSRPSTVPMTPPMAR